MPAQSQQQTPTVQTVAPTLQAPTSGESRGNAAAQDQLRERTSVGRLTWQGALGESMGGKLYDALSAQLTDEKLVGHANRLVGAGLSNLRQSLAGQTTTLDEKEAAALLLAELDKGMKQVARDAVTASGLAEGIRGAVDAHPYEIALAAIAGAVAYVLSNQDLPLLQTRVGLGGGSSMIAGVDPGRTMKLALEQVRVGYRYDGNGLAAQLVADRFQNGHAISGSLQHQSGDATYGLEGSVSRRDGTEERRLDLSYRDPELSGRVGFSSVAQGGRNTSAINGSITDTSPSGLQRSLSGSYRNDGSWEASAGIGQSRQNESWSVEAFAGKDAMGNSDRGVRAIYRLRF